MDLVFGVGRGGCTSVAEGHSLPSKFNQPEFAWGLLFVLHSVFVQCCSESPGREVRCRSKDPDLVWGGTVKDWVCRDRVSGGSLRPGFPPRGLYPEVTWLHVVHVHAWPLVLSVQHRLEEYSTPCLCVRSLLILLVPAALQLYQRNVSGIFCPMSCENKDALQWNSYSRRAWE